MSESYSTDVVIIGAGAAGFMCAIRAAERGRKVMLIDHANKVAKKILMSGGGRCNFTNMFIEDENFLSSNQHFFKSALSRFTQWDFIALVENHQIPYHEKKLGQLFCDHKSSDIVQMLVKEAQSHAVEIRTHCEVKSCKINATESDSSLSQSSFVLQTSIGKIKASSLVVATGGLSIPTMGATGFGYQLAEQFGHSLLPQRAGLVPFTFSEKQLQQFDGLAGLSTEVIVEANNQSFRENLLFTHKGLSGPAILQISSYWNLGEPVTINLLPDVDLFEHLKTLQKSRPKLGLSTVLSEFLPKNLAQHLVHLWCPIKNLADYSFDEFQHITDRFNRWQFYPSGTEGYRTAEVTLGGVNPDELSSKTMASKVVDNLYFIGEVVDVTGHLGGFNFQWAWASGVAAGEYV